MRWRRRIDRHVRPDLRRAVQSLVDARPTAAIIADINNMLGSDEHVIAAVSGSSTFVLTPERILALEASAGRWTLADIPLPGILTITTGAGHLSVSTALVTCEIDDAGPTDTAAFVAALNTTKPHTS